MWSTTLDLLKLRNTSTWGKNSIHKNGISLSYILLWRRIFKTKLTWMVKCEFWWLNNLNTTIKFGLWRCHKFTLEMCRQGMESSDLIENLSDCVCNSYCIPNQKSLTVAASLKWNCAGQLWRMLSKLWTKTITGWIALATSHRRGNSRRWWWWRRFNEPDM